MNKLPRTVFRRLDGILLLDKPPGLSSNQALQRVRHLFRAEKAGHTGSLDPLATGLLPICFGEATKIAGSLLGARKAYETVARLGITTDTDDAEGQPLRERPVARLDRRPDRCGPAPAHRPHPASGRRSIRRSSRAASRCTPRPAAARSIEVDPSARWRSSFDCELLRPARMARPLLRLQVTCGSGTYMRSLVRDLGEAAGLWRACGGTAAPVGGTLPRAAHVDAGGAAGAGDERGERSAGRLPAAASRPA